MHIETARRLLKVADRLPKKKAQDFLKRLASAYIFTMERPTYTLTRRQLNAALSEPE